MGHKGVDSQHKASFSNGLTKHLDEEIHTRLKVPFSNYAVNIDTALQSFHESKANFSIQHTHTCTCVHIKLNFFGACFRDRSEAREERLEVWLVFKPILLYCICMYVQWYIASGSI